MCDGSAGADTLIADLCVWGIWESLTETLFDIRVVDTDARSYCTCSPCNVLGSAEVEKKPKINICRLVRIDVPHLHHSVSLYMVCLVMRLSFSLRD